MLQVICAVTASIAAVGVIWEIIYLIIRAGDNKTNNARVISDNTTVGDNSIVDDKV